MSSVTKATMRDTVLRAISQGLEESWHQPECEFVWAVAIDWRGKVHQYYHQAGDWWDLHTHMPADPEANFCFWNTMGWDEDVEEGEEPDYDRLAEEVLSDIEQQGSIESQWQGWRAVATKEDE